MENFTLDLLPWNGWSGELLECVSLLENNPDLPKFVAQLNCVMKNN